MVAGNIVWLASYPKSGNTWVRLLLGNLLNLADDDDAASQDFNALPGIASARWPFDHLLGANTYELSKDEIDRSRPDVYRGISAQAGDVVFMKAHDSFQVNSDGEPIFPGDCSRGAVYIVRNPLDVAVSYSHHRGDSSFEKTVRSMSDPNMEIGGNNREQLHQLLGDWSQHYRSWTSQSEVPVLVVRYEDLQADTAGKLQQIAEFAGLDDSKFAMSYEQAAEASRFERLQKIEAEKGFNERPLKSERFFRSGRSGEGKEKLSPQLQQELTSRHTAVMQELGYL